MQREAGGVGNADRGQGRRLASLDQFRGYTVAGMLLVNFVGGFAAVPSTLRHHHTYCSYADTIMPQFFFAVGMAYRMTFLKRLAAGGPRSAYGHAVARNLGLILFGLVFHHLDGGVKTWAELQELGLTGFLSTAFQRSPFQTLVHIGMTSLWVLPVVGRSGTTRMAFLVGSALLHLGLSWAFYFDFAWNRPVIDGGVLAFLSWTIPLLAGTLTYDAMAGAEGRAPLGRILLGALALMAVGYGVSSVGAMEGGATSAEGWLAAPPFSTSERPVDMWTMSQRAGSVSYLAFSAGFAQAVFVLFVLLCDRGGFQLDLFGTFGRQALAAYVMHDLVAQAVKPYVPRDAPIWYVAAGFATYFGMTWLFVRHIDRKGARL